jgi:ABC-type Fe3+ transport system substrate-binding protein
MGVWKLAATLVVAALAGAPAFAQDAAEWNKVVEAAKKEGTVFVYHAQLGAPHWRQAVKTFEEKYKISVQQIDARASELSERIRVEQTTGKYVADLEFHGAGTIVRQIADGYVQPHGGVPNAKNLRPDFAAKPMSIPAWIQAAGILINTNLVKPADEPKVWHDLLDPKWKGKLLSDDPRALGSGQTFFFVTYKTYGRDFHEKFKAQDLHLSRDLRESARRIARGEFPILAQQIFGFASDLKGLPVKAIVPNDGAAYVLIEGAILRGAPRPNAARVLINHILETETQMAYANAWYTPVVAGIADKLTDPDAKRIAAGKLLGTTNADEQQAMLDLASQIYK